MKTPSADTQVGSLSGGNQQKVLFARSLACAPTVMLADEPTRGVDVGARMELYRILRGVADEGAAVVVLSTDAVELQGLCDRVLVFSRGVVVGELVGDGVTEQAITGAAITADAGLVHTSASNARWATIRRFLSGDYAPAVILTALILDARSLHILRESVLPVLAFAWRLPLSDERSLLRQRRTTDRSSHRRH